jgi:uncharacterized C2H2 Zn-finger protein
MAKAKMAKKQEEPHKCMRCGRFFKSRLALKRHSNDHLRALEEMKMLREGQMPDESKLGFEFKGKNKIIIS